MNKMKMKIQAIVMKIQIKKIKIVNLIHHLMCLYLVIMMKIKNKSLKIKMKMVKKRKRVDYVNMMDFQKKKENKKLKKKKEKKERQNFQKILKKFLQKNKDDLN